MAMFYDPPTNFLKGSVTITAGNTSAQVTHGLGTTPTLVWYDASDENGKSAFTTALGLTTFTANIPAAQATDVTLRYGVS